MRVAVPVCSAVWAAGGLGEVEETMGGVLRMGDFSAEPLFGDPEMGAGFYVARWLGLGEERI